MEEHGYNFANAPSFKTENSLGTRLTTVNPKLIAVQQHQQQKVC
jgi:hypothetical protein